MPQFETVPNQKIICVLGEGKAVCDSKHVYLRAQKEAMFEAMKDLNPSTFEVWLYFASQSDGYTFAFSPAAITKETGITKYCLQEGVRKLRDKHYLIQRGNSNVYDFYEIPFSEEEMEMERVVIHKNGYFAETPNN